MIVYLAGLMGRHDLLLEGIRHEDISCRRKLQNTHYQPLGNNYKGGNSLDKDNMNLYLAGEHEVKNGSVCKSWEGVNILETYFTARNNKHIGRLINSAKNFILDSGAFTFRQSMANRDVAHKNVDWTKYADEYADFVKAYDIKLFFELDIDNITGYDYVVKLRERINKRAGRNCIPVWHTNRGKQNFIDMCKEYEYVAIGGLTGKAVTKKIPDKMFPWFIDTAHENGAKIHGLGYTQLSKLNIYHFDSVDSTAWLYGNRGGYIYRFNTLTGIMEKYQKEGSRVKPRETAIHNFKEWIKLCNYAERYW